MTALNYPLSDRTLAQRLELAEALVNVEMVEARHRVSPEVGATWIERAGARAMFDGAGSPLTQTFGLGLFDDPQDADFEALEAFFGERGTPALHEVSPLASPATFDLLNARGYEPFEFSSVLFRPAGTDDLPHPNPAIVVRIATRDDDDAYRNTSAEAWGAESPELGDFLHEMARVMSEARGTTRFLAEIEGRAVATGVLAMHEGIALLAGAATLPEARFRGAQLALLTARLRYAAEHDCDLAMMAAQPGSASQRNAERRGFRIAYTRMKWRIRNGRRS